MPRISDSRRGFLKQNLWVCAGDAEAAANAMLPKGADTPSPLLVFLLLYIKCAKFMTI